MINGWRVVSVSGNPHFLCILCCDRSRGCGGHKVQAASSFPGQELH